MLQQKTERNRLLAQLHIALKQKRITDESYRNWLEKLFSVRSSTELDDDQLKQAVKLLRSAGWLDGRGRGATNGNGDRPTDKQWSKLAALSRQMGWSGLEDKALATFVLRIAKVNSPRFLNREQMRKVITALQKWRESLDKKAAKTQIQSEDYDHAN